MVDSSRSTVISSGRSELREVVGYMLWYYQRRRFRFESSCSIAFLRNVEPQESAEYNATGLFCALKRLFPLLSHLNKRVLDKVTTILSLARIAIIESERAKRTHCCTLIEMLL